MLSINLKQALPFQLGKGDVVNYLSEEISDELTSRLEYELWSTVVLVVMDFLSHSCMSYQGLSVDLSRLFGSSWTPEL